jgi:hypothetical protein
MGITTYWQMKPETVGLDSIFFFACFGNRL